MGLFSINIAKTVYPEVKQAKFVGNFHRYTINKGMFSKINHGLRTENIDECTAGVINAGKTNFMFHAAPDMQPTSTIKKELEKQVEILRETCDDVRAFICGGFELDTKNPSSVKSFDLYNTIADTLDELGVKFTMMCGKNKGQPTENIYAVNDNVTVWSDAFKNLFKSSNKEKLSKDEIIDLLEQNYQFVESNCEHKLNITDNCAAKIQKLVG